VSDKKLKKSPLESRFELYVNQNCFNGHLRFSQMNLGKSFAVGIRDIL
jgi:hypothetical protein